MAVQNGCIIEADELISLQKYALVSAGQNFINSMKVASPHTDYEFIKGRHFACNQGNASIKCSYGLDTSGTIDMFQTNFTDCFPTTGCYPTGTGQYLGCFTGTACCGATYWFCVCTPGTFTNYTRGCVGGYNSATGTSRMCWNLRPYADVYCFVMDHILCQDIPTGSCKNDCCITACSYVCVNSNVLFTYCCVFCMTDGKFCNSTGVTCYELRKVPNTYTCYCFLCNNSLVCCLDTNAQQIFFCTINTGANLGGGGAPNGTHWTCLNFTNITQTYTGKRYILMNVMDLKDVKDFLSLNSVHADGGGEVKYELMHSDFCSTGIFLTPDSLCDVTGCLDCECYQLRIYNNCIANCVDGSPATISAFALTGISRSPTI
jgi:hypothetical protein